MAKIPPAAAAAPVLDQAIDEPVDGGAAPKKRFSLRMPAFMARLPRLKLPFRIALSKKLIVIIGAAVATVSVAGAAAIALWPNDPAVADKPLVAKKSKKAKGAKGAASAVLAAASAASASSAEATDAAASTPAQALAAAPAASGPEDPMDKLRRRLGETLSSGGKLESSGPGELKVTSRQGEPKAAATARASQRVASTDTHDGDTPVTSVHAVEKASKAGAAALHDLHWSYDGQGGPESWGKLTPEFAKCATGARQSPIDIRDGIQVNLDPVQFDYKPSSFRVIDNGHTVQVNVAPGNFIEVGGKRFELLQFHFHRPSEERVDGKQFDMVAHLVHKDADGKLAVVAVLLERGSAQGVIQAVWNNLPLEKGEEQAARVPIDLNQLLPAERSYYTYMGSLTTPPCSEGVLWMVMKKPVQIAPDQIGIFARMYPMNARPIQSASGRMIKESN